MPGVHELPHDPDRIAALDFLYGVGEAGGDPAADTLVAISRSYGAFLYNPSGAAGAAGDNGTWGVWHRLCSNGCIYPSDGLVTAAGTVLLGGGLARGASRGRSWTYDVDSLFAYPFIELTAAEPVGAILAGVGPESTARSLADGAPGTWQPGGRTCCFLEAFGEVPPSPPLPRGRVLLGVDGGIRYSDDGGLSYTQAAGTSVTSSIAWSFTFLPQPGHPYGGVAYAGVQNFVPPEGGEFRGAEALRSDDGGATWARAHRFTRTELGFPPYSIADVTGVILYATPDGALWAGVSHNVAIPHRGGIMRSADGGQTWARADAGFRDSTGRGYRVNQFRLSRTGVLYAATERGMWRTTTAVVAGEASPVAVPEGVAVSVRPNPAWGRVEVIVSLAEAQAVRIVVLDALGREVAVVHDGEAAAGEQSVSVDTVSWPAGVYVVRATAGVGVATARLVVAR